MKVGELISAWREQHVDVEALRRLPRDQEVTRKTLADAGVDMDVYDSMPLWGIAGIGPSRAVVLWKSGVRMSNLGRHAAALPEVTRVWLRYQPLQRIPRARVLQAFNELVPEDERQFAEIVGSYRRERPTSGDVDILYSGPNLDRFLDRLAQMHRSKWIVLSRGEQKVAGIFRLTAQTAVEVDIWIATKDTYPFMLLYATGSKLHNIRMRFVAKHRGLMLNQYGLWRGTVRIPARNERAIFDALGMKWKEPRDRE
jgi:DNA polymerase/3'-5' exonuclease PolX